MPRTNNRNKVWKLTSAERNPEKSSNTVYEARISCVVWSDTMEHLINLSPTLEVLRKTNKPTVYIVYPKTVELPDICTEGINVIKVFKYSHYTTIDWAQVQEFVNSVAEE